MRENTKDRIVEREIEVGKKDWLLTEEGTE